MKDEQLRVAVLAEAEMAGGTFNRFLPIFVEQSQRLPGVSRRYCQA
jgi:hypothetical protein